MSGQNRLQLAASGREGHQRSARAVARNDAVYQWRDVGRIRREEMVQRVPSVDARSQGGDRLSVRDEIDPGVGRQKARPGRPRSSKDLAVQRREPCRVASSWDILRDRFRPAASRPYYPSLYHTLLLSTLVSSIGETSRVLATADVYFRPPIEHIGLFHFSRLDEAIEVGYRSGLETLGPWWDGRKTIDA